MIHGVLTTACLLALLATGCSQSELQKDESEKTTTVMPSGARLSFLGREGCVNTPVLLQNLKTAVDSSNVSIEYNVFDQLELSSSDPRRGYPTPTILLDGNDIFGMAEPVPPFMKTSCRLYPGGVPSAEMIAERLGMLLE